MSDELGFELDQLEFDWVILGTGYEESLYAAHLAKIQRAKVLVLDFAPAYSNNSKTLNFKEFHKQETNSFKQPLFTFLNNNQSELNAAFADQINNSQDFKYFNLDMNPKLLFSISPTVNLLTQANMDQYMDFKSISAQYYFDKVFRLTPTTKSDIFKSKFLSLFEKKHFFQLLHQLIKLYNRIEGIQVDQNSTREFDQSVQLDDEIYEKYTHNKDKPARIFLESILNLNKEQQRTIFSILFYSIAFDRYHYDSPYSLRTDQFVSKVGKYVSSMGIHSSSPFLYANYGSGDISQGLSRIAAVHGTTYILSEKLKIQKIDQELNGIVLHSNLNKTNNIKVSKGIIAMPEAWSNLRESQQLDQQLLRMTIITTKNKGVLSEQTQKFIKEEQQENMKYPEKPSIYIVPAGALTEHPIFIFRVDSNSNSTHKNYEAFQVSTIVGQQEIEVLQQSIETLAHKIDEQYSENPEPSINHICYIQSCVQNYSTSEYSFKIDNQFYQTSQDNFDIDFDQHSINFQKNVCNITENVNSHYLSVPEILDDEPDRVDFILSQLETIKNK